MYEVIPGAYTDGQIPLEGDDIYAPDVDPVNVRGTIGMVSSGRIRFPTMSIYDNVAAGLKLTGPQRQEPRRRRGEVLAWREPLGRGQGSPDRPGAVRRSAAAAVHRAGYRCEPQVLMDEPASALDPISTLAIEDPCTS